MFVNHLYNHFQVMSDSESDEENENEENEEAPASPPPPQVTTLFSIIFSSLTIQLCRRKP